MEHPQLGEWLKHFDDAARRERVWQLGLLTGLRAEKDGTFPPGEFRARPGARSHRRAAQAAHGAGDRHRARARRFRDGRCGSRLWRRRSRSRTADIIPLSQPQDYALEVDGQRERRRASCAEIWARHLDPDLVRRIEPLTGPTTSTLPALLRDGRRFDFIFIDAGHDLFSVAHDLAYSAALLAPGGAILMDDFAPMEEFGLGTCVALGHARRLFAHVRTVRLRRAGLRRHRASRGAARDDLPRRPPRRRSRSIARCCRSGASRVFCSSAATARAGFPRGCGDDGAALRPSGALLRLPSRLAFRRALSRRPIALPRGAPALSYGGVLPREPGAIVAGGRVKLRHLDRAFPEQEHFNVLYLVSSAVPPHAGELVRWAKARGAKLVWNQNGVAFPAWAGRRFAETNRPMAELRRLADFVVYQSEFCRESADRFLGAVAVAVARAVQSRRSRGVLARAATAVARLLATAHRRARTTSRGACSGRSRRCASCARRVIPRG